MKFFLIFVLMFGITTVYAYPDYIKTVQCHPVGEHNAEPVIELGSRKQIFFSFDDHSEQVNSYSYKIVHCTPEWQKTEISMFHYIEGFNLQPLSDYEFSFNTVKPYTHFELLFPNDDIKFRLSGNYMLQIINDDYPDSIVIAQPFSVLENRVSIVAELQNCTNPHYLATSQELRFTIGYDEMHIANPIRDVRVYVTQNQDPNSRRDLKPTFVRAGQLVYGDGFNNIFNGLAPFRRVQLYSLVYFTQYVKDIIRSENGLYNAILVPETPYPDYVPLPNQGGNYTIRAENVNKPQVEAEYIAVYFALYYPEEIVNSDVYVYGKFSNWEFSPSMKMSYDIKNKAYTGNAVLKQGDYDYTYAVLPRKGKTPDLTTLQGNFYQNRNEYNIRCYLYDFRHGYYRMVGYRALKG